MTENSDLASEKKKKKKKELFSQLVVIERVVCHMTTVQN